MGLVPELWESEDQDDMPQDKELENNFGENGLVASDASSTTRQSRRKRRASFGTVVYIDTEWNKPRFILARFITSHVFEAFMTIVICFNMIFVIHVTNTAAKNDGILPTWMQVTSNVLLGVYFSELVCKLYSFRRAFFDSKTNIMDLCVVATDATLLMLENILGELPSATVLRILRLLRLLRAGRIFNEVPELYVMISGMVSTVRAMLCAMILIALTLALWSIVAVEFLNPLAVKMHADGSFGDCERCGRAYSSVQQSMLTFFQSTIAGDSWGMLALPMIEREPACALIIIPCIISVNLGLLNLLLTAIVNQANKAREDDQQQRLREKKWAFEQTRARLLSLCKKLDVDKNGELSYAEILQGFDEHEDFADCLRLLDIGRDDLDLVFKYLDIDESGEVSYEEFVQQLYQLKTKATHTLLVYVKTSLREVHNDLGAVHNDLSAVHNDLGEVHKDLWRVHNDLVQVKSTVGKQSGVPEQVGENGPQREADGVTESDDAQESKPVAEQKSKLHMPNPSFTGHMPQIVGELHRFSQQVDAAMVMLLQDIVKKNEEQAALLQSNSRQLSELGQSLVKFVRQENEASSMRPQRMWSLPAIAGLAGADLSTPRQRSGNGHLAFREVQPPPQPHLR